MLDPMLGATRRLESDRARGLLAACISRRFGGLLRIRLLYLEARLTVFENPARIEDRSED